MAKKELELDADLVIDEADTQKEPRVYELAFHIDPEKTENEAYGIFEKIKKLAGEKGTVVAHGAPHKITLAYTMSRMEPSGRHDFDGSYFAWIAYEADGAGHTAVTELVQGEKNIFRFLDIKTTKEEALLGEELHNARMEEAKKAAQPVDVEDEVAEATLDTELDAALKEAGV